MCARVLIIDDEANIRRMVGALLASEGYEVREAPGDYLDRRTIEEEGLDAAARDFLAGMTDRYSISLYEHLFIPKSWA